VSQNPLGRAELPLSFHISICKTSETPILYPGISGKDVPWLFLYLSDKKRESVRQSLSVCSCSSAWTWHGKLWRTQLRGILDCLETSYNELL